MRKQTVSLFCEVDFTKHTHLQTYYSESTGHEHNAQYYLHVFLTMFKTQTSSGNLVKATDQRDLIYTSVSLSEILGEYWIFFLFN